jgi:transcriptional regulator of acetoin/glycerol metabolism
VLEALEKNDWNVTETARELDLARSHLYNLIHGLELKRSKPDDPAKGHA